MRSRIGPRDKFPLMSDINMIPLIDVSLVLLIIFMVLTPFLVSSQIKVNLPKAVSGIATDSEPIKIMITKKKNFYINNQSILPEDLGRSLRALMAKEKDPVVLIESDGSVPLSTVIKAMDQAKVEGAFKLGVAVTPIK